MTVDINHFKFHPHDAQHRQGDDRSSSPTRRASSTRRPTPGSFNTGKIKPGHSVAVRFTAKGTYRYHCTIHPVMHGKIIVG